MKPYGTLLGIIIAGIFAIAVTVCILILKQDGSKLVPPDKPSYDINGNGSAILVWIDYFKDSSLNNWEIAQGGGGFGNEEVQIYRKDQVKAEKGLQITASKIENQYYSGKIQTNALFRADSKFGLWIEGRISLPAGGVGIWPAFWMLPKRSAYGAWPQSGEIDIMEAVNVMDTIYSGIHFGMEKGNYSTQVKSGISEGFHTYAVEWRLGSIKFFVDSKLFHSVQPRAETNPGGWWTWKQNKPHGAPLSPNDFPFHETEPWHLEQVKTSNIGEWHKKIGDEIQPGDILVEIETDKAQMDMECQEEGFLAKILIDAGGKDISPICVLAENKDDVEKFASFSAPSATQKTTVPVDAPPTLPAQKTVPVDVPTTSLAPPASPSRIFVSPIAKALAAEKGIDLVKVKGTGPEGRIVKDDILKFGGFTLLTLASPLPSPIAPVVSNEKVPLNEKVPVSSVFKDIPLSNVRKIIANRLAESKATIPHYYMTQEIDVSKVLKLREALNKESNGKFKLSVNDFVIKASSLALLDIPQMNSSWHGSFIREYQNADIAVAVATESGLITPIITSSQNLGLAKISNKVKLLAEKARTGKLTPNEYQGGTFTISNLGMYGVNHFTAIINPPHAGILAVGGISDKLVLDEKSSKGFKATKVMSVTLSPDHRVVDGAVAAQWMQKFQAYLEQPLNFLL